MAILTKSQLTTANSSSFPDNNSQLITPQVLRDFNQSVIDTLVDSLDTGSFANTGITNAFTQQNNFTSISASSFVSASNFVGDGSKLTNITASVSLPILDEGVLQGYATSMNFTGSAISAAIVAGTAIVNVNIEGAGLVTTQSFNPFTQSVNQFTQSAQTSINALNQSSASQQVSINALNVFTASQSTASIVNSISSLNQFTQSAGIRLTNLETTTASLNTSVSNLNSATASINTSITNLNSTTASINSSITQLNASSASQQVSINAINQATQSLQNRTGSYATTGSNTFSGNQIISGTFQVTDGNDARFSVGVNANDIVMIAGATSNISMSFGGDLAMFGDNVSLRNSVGDAQFVIYNGTGAAQKAYTTQVTATGPSGSWLLKDAQYNKTYITVGGSDGNVYVEAPLRVNAPFTASLQQGYVWVGNASGVSSLVATSSFIDTFVSGNLVTTSSFNAYTSSNNQRVNSLEINSASVNISVSALNTFTASQSTASLVTSITNLNTFSASALVSISNLNSATASLFGSASLALTTASFNNGTRNLTFTKGDNQTFSVNIPDVSGSAGTFVTTSSFNAYTQSNDQRVSSLEANSASVNTSIANINTTTASLNTSVSALNTFTASQSTASLVTSINNLNTFSASALVSISNLNTTTQSLNTSVTNLNSATSSLFGSASLSLYTASAVGNTITFTKGDTSTFSVSVVAAPIDTGSFATTASFNAYTSSTNSRLNNIETTTASLNTSVSNLNTATASLFTSTSLSLITASFNNGTRNLTFTKGDNQTFSVNIPDVSGSVGGFATLGANTFTGSQTISSSLNVSGSASFVGGDVNFTDQGRNINIDVDGIIIKGQKAVLISQSLDIQNTLTASLATGFTYVGNATGRTTTVATSSFGTPIPSGTISGSAQITALGFVSSSVTASSLVTASVNLNTITFTKGDASTFALTVNTGSGGGGAAFPFTGDAVITGSLLVSGSGIPDVTVIGNVHITGSLVGQPITLSVSANTASLNMTAGNNFVLTLPSSSTTHITATNLIAGQTLNLLIKQQVGPGTGSITFAPSILFPSGLDMQATATGSAIDLISMISFDTTNLMAANVKNLK